MPEVPKFQSWQVQISKIIKQRLSIYPGPIGKHTAGEVTEDNENTLSSSWNFLDLFRLSEDIENNYSYRKLIMHVKSEEHHEVQAK